MTKPLLKRDKQKSATRGGARAGAGRPKGGKNRPTLDREAEVASQIDRMRAGAETGKEALERMVKFAEGCVSLLRPTTARELEAGKAKNPDGDWDRFGQWFDRWAYASKELTKYQSPTFKAIAVSATLPQAPKDDPRVVDGQVLRLPDAEAAAQAYLRLIGVAA